MDLPIHAFIDWDSVGHAITRVHDNASSTTGSVQRKHSLDRHVHGWHVERLEHDLCHLLPVGLGVEWGLSEQNWLLLGGNAQLVIECVVPDLLHVVPIGDDAVLHRVLQRQDASFALCLIAHVRILFKDK